MPVIGYFAGFYFSDLVSSVDHWIAFVLLSLIGANMIKESFETDSCDMDSDFSFKVMFAMAVATSIDALAVGVAFALEYERNTVFVAVTLIGVITALLSAVGVFIGHRFSAKYKNKAEFVGGLVLVIMGFKFLLEGLGIIGG